VGRNVISQINFVTQSTQQHKRCSRREIRKRNKNEMEWNGTAFLEVEIASKELESNNCLLLTVLNVTAQSGIDNGLLLPSTLHAHLNALYLLVLQVYLRKGKEMEEEREGEEKEEEEEEEEEEEKEEKEEQREREEGEGGEGGGEVSGGSGELKQCHVVIKKNRLRNCSLWKRTDLAVNVSRYVPEMADYVRYAVQALVDLLVIGLQLS
jgi:hypothetical protein